MKNPTPSQTDGWTLFKIEFGLQPNKLASILSPVNSIGLVRSVSSFTQLIFKKTLEIAVKFSNSSASLETSKGIRK